MIIPFPGRPAELDALDGRPSWGDQLETCCTVLAGSSARLIKSSWLTGRLDDRPDDDLRLVDAAGQLAERYDLTATVDVAGAGFTVRFSRQP